ncbi:MAG: hypothetical protein KDC84_08770 [Crocinitomicaceae bacterium]|nr:hypothetical protein [Crocinitomicaceae bacterium]
MGTKKRSKIEKYAFESISSKEYQNRDGEIHILSPEEQKDLKRIRLVSLSLAALAGAVGVVACYVPYHTWPEYFPDHMIQIPIWDEPHPVPVVFLVFSLILVIIEIAFLTYNNIRTVREVSHACGYPSPTDKEFEQRVDQLVSVGLEKKPKNQSELGINPYFGMPKFYVFLITVFNIIKATLTNALMKLIVRRLLGRYALRMLVDLLGIPIYAFWNAWAANRVYKEAKTRVLAPPNIQILLNHLVRTQKDNPEFRAELYHILDYLAITKRAFHDNHYLLSKFALAEFEIKVDPDHVHDEQFLERIQNGSELTKKGFSQLMLFGMLIEGSLSFTEKRKLKELSEKGIFIYSMEESKMATKDYYEGRGIGFLVQG